jgi:site-specific DNA-methyltransferase (adenine-specific)
MIGMKRYPDKFFELAIVDPPYGIGEDWKKRTNNRRVQFKESSYKNTPATKEYFDELKRVSKDWIIWGWNYYTEYLGPTNYLIVWDKVAANNDVFCYSKCEIAATTKRIPCNIVSISWDGYRMGAETGVDKIHPHQKPKSLYKWLLTNYAKPGDKILDTHLGSGSSRIAAYDMGFDFYGFELDKDYYQAQEKRFAQFKMQGKLFT